MENAEVLEMTVKKVEDVLKNRSQGLCQISVISNNSLFTPSVILQNSVICPVYDQEANR